MQKAIISFADIDNFDVNNEQEKQNLISVFEKAYGFELVHLKGEEKSSFCLHYDPQVVSLSNIRVLLATQGYMLNQKFESLSIIVSNLDCMDCVKIIEHVLIRLPGVISVFGSYTTGAFRVDYNSAKLYLPNINNRLESLGYEFSVVNTTPDVLSIKPHLTPNKEHTHDYKSASNEIHLGCGGSHKNSDSFFGKYKEIILSSITGILWLIGFICEKSNSVIIANILFLGGYITGGYATFIDSIRAFLQRRFTIESLMIFAAIGAGFIDKLNEGVLLLFLFGFGHALEHLSLEKAKKSIKALADLSPKKALLKKEDGSTIEVLVDNLMQNQIVIVKAGQVIPVDGEIIVGSSSISQSAITGESIPLLKTVGEEVYAGTINIDGLIEVKITKLASETMLSKMIRLITESGTQKSNMQLFAEKFEKIFVPMVLIFILLIAILPPVLGLMPIKYSVYLAIIILVSASPCALALATPVAVLVGISRATSLGVLVKGGAALENLGQIKAIAFDKTGTLTQGKFIVTGVELFGSYTKHELLSLAYGLEYGSTHPLAHAVIEYAKELSIDKADISDIHTIAGKGVIGVQNGKLVQLGNYKLFDILPSKVCSVMDKIEKSGSTSMFLAIDGEFVGAIGLADQLRDNIANTLLRLKELGVKKNIMLTGDNKIVAQAIGKQLDIDEIKSELLPEDKLKQIKRLTELYQYTAMIGDGINDAPAMANATVGIAMGGTKTDIAIETADVVLMNDRIDKLPEVINLSKNVSKIIKQNLFISLFVITGLVVAGLFSFTNIVLAVGIHEGSTLVVIFNALRLLYNKK